MERTDPSITPDEIREIRRGLGLSQVEAGELLGGGTRAFTKYEAGTVKPRASVVRLLRVLEANPDALASLKGGGRPSASAVNVLPFEVKGEHIALLTDRTFPLLSSQVAQRRGPGARAARARHSRRGQHYHSGRW